MLAGHMFTLTVDIFESSAQSPPSAQRMKSASLTTNLALFLFVLLIFFVTVTLQAPQRQPQSEECLKSGMTCPWKVWSHYTHQGCQPQYEKDPCCPNRFKCPDRSVYKDNSVCRYGSASYEIGLPINQSDTCRRCYCRESNSELIPQIECMHSECPEHLLPPDPSCILLYSKETDCCSMKTFCPNSEELNDSKPAAICEHANKTYIRGERIEFDGDQCIFCICDDRFDGPNGPGCRRIDYCYLDSQQNIGKGCVPVYNVDTCCPTDWMCPELDTLPLVFDENTCIFDGKAYPLGTKLPTNLDCVECKCRTPPDFTCVQSRCYK